MANLTIGQINDVVSGLRESMKPNSNYSFPQDMQQISPDFPVSPDKGAIDTNAPDAASKDGKTFSQILNDSFKQVNELQNQADTAVKELVAGRTKNIHETMLTLERADTSLKLMMQVRNKILDAYREIMRMQV